MNSSVKILAGIGLGGLVVFLYFKYKKSAAAPANTTTIGNAIVNGQVKPVAVTTTPAAGSNIVNEASPGVIKPQLHIKDPHAYIQAAIASGNVKTYKAGDAPLQEGDVMKTRQGEYAIVS